MFLFVAIGLFICFALLGCGSKVPEKQATSDVSPLTIESSSGTHMFEVELALDDRSQAQGLMFRRSMAPDHGMLFVYGGERQISMWMKNTILSLDMLFVKRDGTIAKIFMRTEPFSERVLSSDQPVYAVLELNAGIVDKLGIKPGDRLIHPLLRVR